MQMSHRVPDWPVNTGGSLAGNRSNYAYGNNALSLQWLTWLLTKAAAAF